MMDYNDAPAQRQDGIIPDGAYAKVRAQLRAGGHTLPNSDPIDAGLLKQSQSSDVVMLDFEFTVLAGAHSRRKFWQLMTVAGGQVDEKGVSKGWNITKASLRAMIDSALGCDPKDMSDATKAKRVLRGFKDLDGIEFVAKIGVEKGSEAPQGGYYPDKNKLSHVVTPDEPEWKTISDGGEVAARPSGSAPASSARRPASSAQAKPAWQQSSATSSAAATADTAAPAAKGGPAWLNG